MEMPERIYAEQDPETNAKRWYSTKGMGVEYVRAENRNNAKHYAAALYAITNARPDMPADERAKLASAIVDCQRARNLID